MGALSSEFSWLLSKIVTGLLLSPGVHLNLNNSPSTAVCSVHCSAPLAHSSRGAFWVFSSYHASANLSHLSHKVTWSSGIKHSLPPHSSALQSFSSLLWAPIVTSGLCWVLGIHFLPLLFLMLLYFSICIPNIGEAVSLLLTILISPLEVHLYFLMLL